MPICYLALSLHLFVVLALYKEPYAGAPHIAFTGCVFLLETWFLPFVDVAATLWQVAGEPEDRAFS